MLGNLFRASDENRWASAFRAEKQNYQSQIKPPIEPPTERIADIVAQLHREGTVIIPGFISRETAEKWHAALFEDLMGIHAKTFTGDNRVEREEAYGVYRMHRADLRAPETEEFFASEFIKQVASAYHTPDMEYYARMAELRAFPGRVSSADGFHIDEAYKYKFKAFLYLNDISAANAPFVFLKGSHEEGDWRDVKGSDMVRYSQVPHDEIFNRRGNFFEPREINFLKERFGYEEVVCEGAAGTLILTDTRAIHRGTVLREGHRLMLGIYMRLKQTDRKSKGK